MSFKFSFDIDDEDDTVVVPAAVEAAASSSTPRAPPQPCKRISLPDLLSTLPENFSYSPLAHPLGGAPLLRRDLYDARFQLAQGEDAAASTSEEYVDADTDLIPGTYEGGLKSWEGGVDLVEVLARGLGGKGKRTAEAEEADVGAWVQGARVLEIGCGTGLPSAYLLRSLLAAAPSSARTTLHLQDYNLPVLSLVTLPNLVLAALPFLPASARAAAETAADEDEEDEDEAPRRPFDAARAGTLDVTPALVSAFTALLEEHGIDLVFTYGDWSGMAVELAHEDKYKLVLTAETIYAEESVGPLIDVLRAAVAPAPAPKAQALEDSLEALSVGDWSKEPLVASDPVVLVAAKVLYFGVGGGLDSFVARVEGLGGWTTRVHDWVRGVGRAVVRIGW
ncbi:hypothetical protein Q8F55_004145 [Vanrija albida]|uniref:protein-histidine N-methyltransferase n=1 Tax=Vanrija albida TaxID=181172 RepID=A0ABR3Q6A8_9TREE